MRVEYGKPRLSHRSTEGNKGIEDFFNGHKEKAGDKVLHAAQCRTGFLTTVLLDRVRCAGRMGRTRLRHRPHVARAPVIYLNPCAVPLHSSAVAGLRLVNNAFLVIDWSCHRTTDVSPQARAGTRLVGSAMRRAITFPTRNVCQADRADYTCGRHQHRKCRKCPVNRPDGNTHQAKSMNQQSIHSNASLNHFYVFPLKQGYPDHLWYNTDSMVVVQGLVDLRQKNASPLRAPFAKSLSAGRPGHGPPAPATRIRCPSSKTQPDVRDCQKA